MAEGSIDIDAMSMRQDENVSAGFQTGSHNIARVHEQEGEKSLDVLRARIDRTEDELSEILDAIQDKLSLDYLKKQAEEKILESVLKEVNGIMERASRTANEMSSTVLDKAKEHPISFALLGVGLSWLIAKGLSGSKSSEEEPVARYNIDGEGIPESLYQSGLEDPGGSEYREGGSLGSGDKRYHPVHRVKETASHVAGGVKDKTKRLTGGSREHMRSTDRGLWHTIEQNPILIGIAALAVGAGLGLMLPSSRRERKMVGKAKEGLSQKAQELGEKTESSRFFRFKPERGSQEEEKHRS